MMTWFLALETTQDPFKRVSEPSMKPGPELKRAISGELSDNAEEMPFISGAIRGALGSKSDPPPLQGPRPNPPLPHQRMAEAPQATMSPQLSITATMQGGRTGSSATSP